MTTYRDDLEATLQRADDLEREMAALRERNQRMEAQLASGDVSEAQAELAARAAEERALAEYQNRPTQLQATRRGRLATSLISGFLGTMLAGSLFADGLIVAAIIAALVFGVFIAWLHAIPRIDPPRRIP